MFCWHHSLGDGRAVTKMLLYHLHSPEPFTESSTTKQADTKVSSTAVGVVAIARLCLQATKGLLAGRRTLSKIRERPGYGVLSVPRQALRELAVALACKSEIAIYVVALAIFMSINAGKRPNIRRRKTTMLVARNYRRAMPHDEFGNTTFAIRVSGNGEMNRVAAARVQHSIDRQERFRSAFEREVFQASMRAAQLTLGKWISDGAYQRIIAGSLSDIAGPCTIVPGPVRPIVFAGARICGMLGFGMLLPGSDCAIAVLTYDQTVSFCFTLKGQWVKSAERVRAVLGRALGNVVDLSVRPQ
jgi:hypothetical protein